MESMPVVKRRKRRIWLALLPVFAALLWYGSSSVGYVANMRDMFVIPAGHERDAAPGSLLPSAIGSPGEGVRGGTPDRGEIWVFSDHQGHQGQAGDRPAPGRDRGSRRRQGPDRRQAAGRTLSDRSDFEYTMAPVPLGPDQYFMLGDSQIRQTWTATPWGRSPIPD